MHEAVTRARVRLVGVSREEGTKRCSLAGAAAGGCGLCWERGLEEQEQLCPPGTRDCCSSHRRDGVEQEKMWIGKALWFLATFLAIFGRAAHTVLKVLFQAENKTKPKSRFGTRQLQVSWGGEGRGDDLAGWEDSVLGCPSLGKGGAAAVWRTRLYAVVSDKDSWNNEANLSLYLRMLFCCC